ncbi:MAG: restriction endonuclease subunit S [Thermodesulfobacteriota bacterium]|nr:restriction endonuclease subunit S [Thermodesulfobacteriota bacterium]
MTIRLVPYPEYKDSGLPWLGEIPNHWEVRRGKSVFKCIDVRSRSGDEELLTVSAKDGVVPRREKKVTMFMAESYAGYKLCWPGDLVINSLWAWAGGLGFSRHHGIISSAYGVYRPRPEFASFWPYFDYLFRSKVYDWELHVRSKGIWVSRLQLTDESFLDMPIVLPPNDEAERLARFLTGASAHINRLIRAKRRLIDLLNEQKQAIIHRAITRGLDPNVRLKPSGIDWLGHVPEDWEIKKLKYKVRFYGGGTPLKAVAEYWNGDIPWVSPKDMKTELVEDAEDHITQEAVEQSSTHLIEAGAVLVVVRSGILRRTIPVAINQKSVALNQDMKALVTKPGLKACYLAALIRGNQHVFLTEWTKQGATVESIEHALLANTRIPVPPIPKQEAIIAFLDKELSTVNQPIERARREIDLLREYRTRLIADVVTGKLDVRGVELPVLTEAEMMEDLDIPEDAEKEEMGDIQEKEI